MEFRIWPPEQEATRLVPLRGCSGSGAKASLRQILLTRGMLAGAIERLGRSQDDMPLNCGSNACGWCDRVAAGIGFISINLDSG
jgi:hypothetical protein